MRYYIFDAGTLKLEDNVELSSVVQPAALSRFKEVTKVRFYKLRAQDASRGAAGKAKAAYAATKKKAINIKEAIKK